MRPSTDSNDQRRRHPPPDLNEEVRRRVLVISNGRFNSLSGRVLVAPEILGAPDAVPFPWRIQIEEG